MDKCHLIRIEKDKTQYISHLFKGWEETLIYTCLQGYMGTAWADSEENPSSAQIVVADFCFFAGEVNEDLIKHRPEEHPSKFVIMVPPNEQWAKKMEEIYGDHAKRITRYAIKKESDVFDLCKLQSYIDQLENEYEVKMINHELYHTAMAHDWSRDLCSQFATYEEYAQYGLGAVVLHNGLLVSGASSYTVYKEGIEIEIDTRADYRRKGLGLACAARLIIACLERGLYPSWDAQNMGSVELAKKLGYHFDKEYVAYEVYEFGCV